MFDPDPALDQQLRALLHPDLKVIDPGLDRVESLLQKLGNPHKRLPPVIHVAGTNGKGSILAFIQAILQAGGYRVHRYGSPHLVRFSERISLNGAPIETRYLSALLARIQALQDTHPATFFEATTVAALCAFAEQSADVVLLETGMGGQLDATNVIEQPAAVAITPVGLDHTEFLGDSIAQIASEKAAIMKPNCPAIIGPQLPEVMAVMQQYAQSLSGVKLCRYGHEWSCDRVAEKWHYTGPKWQMTLPLPALQGEHQVRNAATAMAVLEQCPQFSCSPADRVQGVRNVVWPGRLQCLTDGRWNTFLPVNTKLYVDGGHNAMAAKGLAEWVAQQSALVRPVHVVMGMLKTKDAHGFFAELRQSNCKFHLVELPIEEPSYGASELTIMARANDLDARASGSIEAALQQSAAEGAAMVLLAGSLYLAGYILAWH